MSQASPMLPGGVTAVLIIAIILGGIGGLTNLLGLGAVAFNEQFTRLSMPGQIDGPNQEAMAKFQAANRRAAIIGAPLMVVKLVLSLLIIWSAIGVFRRVGVERDRLRIWFLIAMICEPIILAVTFFNQYLMLEPTRAFYQAISPNMVNMTAAMMIMGAVMVTFLSIAKFVYFWIGRRLLAQLSLPIDA